MTSTTFFFVFIPILAIILLAVNLIFAPHNPYQEKDSVFECGFHSFLGQNRTQFSISFFIFALLFLLFDLEILLVYPYVVSAYTNGIYGLTIMLIFFLALTLGFAFELGKNALKIDSRQMVTLNNCKLSTISNISSFKLSIYRIILKYPLFIFFIIISMVSLLTMLISNLPSNFLTSYLDFFTLCGVGLLSWTLNSGFISWFSESLGIKGLGSNIIEWLSGKTGIKLGNQVLDTKSNMLLKNSDSDLPGSSKNSGKGKAVDTGSGSESDSSKKSSKNTGKGKAVDTGSGSESDSSKTNFADSRSAFPMGGIYGDTLEAIDNRIFFLQPHNVFSSHLNMEFRQEQLKLLYNKRKDLLAMQSLDFKDPNSNMLIRDLKKSVLGLDEKNGFKADAWRTGNSVYPVSLSSSPSINTPSVAGSPSNGFSNTDLEKAIAESLKDYKDNGEGSSERKD